ncbi:MAG: MotA/TolQ/ExbB proton channel family protein [Elusimicrobia bacterium]|nr:MotA/TolQ/ExbB proton channel family protein [Elusimicrobiota bacterium]
MDLMTIIGAVVGLGVVIFILVVGEMAQFLLNFEAIVLIFGGTLGSVMISYPWSALRHVPNAVKMMILPPRRPDANLLVATFVRLAELTRRSGSDALAAELRALPHPFMQDCVQMILDGLDEETIDDRCQRDIIATRHRHMQVSGIFRSAGTYAPIFGLLGTLIGVVQVLRNITNPAMMGTSMAVAMTASFYGIFAANFFFLPVASKLNFYSDEEVLSRELIAKGTLCLVHGEVPWLLAKKLEAYLSFQLRNSGAKGYRVPV